MEGPTGSRWRAVLVARLRQHQIVVEASWIIIYGGEPARAQCLDRLRRAGSREAIADQKVFAVGQRDRRVHQIDAIGTLWLAARIGGARGSSAPVTRTPDALDASVCQQRRALAVGFFAVSIDM